MYPKDLRGSTVRTKAPDWRSSTGEMRFRMPTVSATARQRYLSGGQWTDEFLDDQLEQAAAAVPSRIAVVEGDWRLTYRDLRQHVERLAGALRSRGIGKGDIVSFQLPNWWETSVIHFAAIRIGAVSNPIGTILRERELRFIIEQTQSKILFTPSSYRGYNHSGLADKLRNELDALQECVVVRDHAVERAAATSLGSLLDVSAAEQIHGLQGGETTPRSADDPVLLMYTSGTESDPKGVVHSHNTLMYETRSMIEQFALTDRDSIFMPSPVTHVSGLLYGIHLPVALQTKVALVDLWRPVDAREVIRAEKCTFTVGATPFLKGLVDLESTDDRPPSTLRYFVCGGADVPPNLIRSAADKLECIAVRAYGSTEFPTASAGAPDDDLEQRAMTDGRILGAAEARVLDEQGAVAPAGTPGDLQVRGPEGFLGYLDTSLTAKSLSPEGWISTGDRAVIDSAGYLQIVGRTKDIILRGGENISAKEVEDLLLEHPAISDIAVVAMPDDVLTERACAFVVPRPGMTVTLSDIVGYLESMSVARQKFPERLEIVDALPKTPSGKVQKAHLRNRIKEILLAEQPERNTNGHSAPTG